MEKKIEIRQEQATINVFECQICGKVIKNLNLRQLETNAKQHMMRHEWKK